MVKRLAVASVLMFLFCGFASAAINEVAPGSTPPSGQSPAPPEVSSSEPGTYWNQMSGIVGASILRRGVGVALALRGPLPENFIWEVGGILPHPVKDYANASDLNESPSITGWVNSLSETHIAGFYPLVHSGRFTLDGGAGISIAFVDNRLDFTEPDGQVEPQSTDIHHMLVGPLVQIGGSVALTSLISFRLDLAYVHYSNNETYNTPPFNLGFSGLLIRPALQVKF